MTIQKVAINAGETTCISVACEDTTVRRSAYTRNDVIACGALQTYSIGVVDCSTVDDDKFDTDTVVEVVSRRTGETLACIIKG